MEKGEQCGKNFMFLLVKGRKDDLAVLSGFFLTPENNSFQVLQEMPAAYRS